MKERRGKMKKIAFIVLILSLMLYGGCSEESEAEMKDTYFYSGQSGSWLATYSVSQIISMYYNSLTIQYLFDDESIRNPEEIGPIEYKLDGGSWELSGSSPQGLQGVGSVNTGSIVNADMFEFNVRKKLSLTVKWKDNVEEVVLNLQN